MAVGQFCCKGHEYTPENTRIVKDGSRQCRACDKGRAQARRDKDRVRQKYAKDPTTLKVHCKRGHLLEGENIRWVPSPWGPQKHCLLCRQIRNNGYREYFRLVETGIAAPKEPGPRQTETCKNGHVMDGDNVYIRPDGTGRGCVACRLSNVKRYNERHPIEVARRKANSYQELRLIELESIKKRLQIACAGIEDPAILLSNLREILV